MAKSSLLDDPQAAAQAWRRYRRLMRSLLLLTLGLVGIALTLLFREGRVGSPQLFIGAALAVGCAMLLASAVMGLAFLWRRAGQPSPMPEGGERPDQASDVEDGRSR